MVIKCNQICKFVSIALASLKHNVMRKDGVWQVKHSSVQFSLSDTGHLWFRGWELVSRQCKIGRAKITSQKACLVVYQGQSQCFVFNKCIATCAVNSKESTYISSKNLINVLQNIKFVCIGGGWKDSIWRLRVFRGHSEREEASTHLHFVWMHTNKSWNSAFFPGSGIKNSITLFKTALVHSQVG